MTRGRKVNVAQMVQRVHGTADAKARLNAILATLAGKQTVSQVCLLLGIGERQYFKLRDRFLQAALTWLEPRGSGRPPWRIRLRAEDDARVVELEAALRDLRIDLRASRIREEIALVLPHLVQRSGRDKKAVRRRRRERVVDEAIRVNTQHASENATCVLGR